MAVVEYKLHMTFEGKQKPPFIKKGGRFRNPYNNTFIGWVDDNPEYYVPESLKKLSKKNFQDRQVAIFKADQKNEVEIEEAEDVILPETEQVIKKKTLTEVKKEADEAYDNFVKEMHEKFGTE